MNWDQNKAIWFCRTWLECTTLDPFQRSLIEQLLKEAEQGMEQFRTKLEEYRTYFPAQLYDAMLKTGFRPGP